MKFLGRLFGFRGSIGRGALWLLALPWILLYVTLVALKLSSNLSSTSYSSRLAGLLLPIAFLLLLSALVRRLHDLRKTGALVLVIFAPALISLALIVANLIEPLHPFLMLSVIVVSALFTAWGVDLLIELAFRKGRRPREDPEQAPNEVSLQRV